MSKPHNEFYDLLSEELENLCVNLEFLEELHKSLHLGSDGKEGNETEKATNNLVFKENSDKFDTRAMHFYEKLEKGFSEKNVEIEDLDSLKTKYKNIVDRKSALDVN